MEKTLSRVIYFLFCVYRYSLSPFLAVVFQVHCRYDESCSHYTQRMIQEKGVFRGSVFGVKRILSCNPWSKTIKN